MNFTHPDTAKPDFLLIIAYNDSMADVTLNDETMKDPDILAFIEDAAFDDEAGTLTPYTLDKTGLGTTIVIYEYAGATEFFTVWHGFEVALSATTTDADGVQRGISEEEQTLIMQFLTDLDISTLVIDE